MIRLRIERPTPPPIGDEDIYWKEGLVWYEDGKPVGRVIIEQEVVSDVKDHPGYGIIRSYRWVPVEVVDGPTD